RYTGIPVRAGAAVEQYRLVVEPFHEPRGNVTRLLILLENLGPSPESPGREEAVDIAKLSREHIGALESELRFTKENLQATVEELETSNEELQATNEELVASNEELQSTNEELHSVNEELYTVNAEYQRKIEELTELTEDMENLLASTRLGVLFLDRGLCVRKFTPGIAEVFNLLPQDVGRRVDGFAHTISHPGLLADVRRVLETEEPVQREVKDRSGADLLLRVLPYRSKGRCGGVVLTLVDISALKREQEKVRLLSAIVESSEDAIVGTDLRGVVATWNRGAAGMFGYAADEAVGRPLSELVVPPELREEFEALHARVRTGERIEQVLTRRRRKDGSPVEVSLGLSPIRDERGEVIGVSSIERDVTALRRAQETLAEREEHIRLLLESTAEAVYGMDLDGRCTFCNPAGVRMLGYRSAEEIVGREMHPLVHHSRPDGRPYPRDECPVYRILRDGAPVHAEEYFWRADGTCFPAEYWAHPVRRGGEMVGAVVTFLDVTERKRAEAELTAAREAAEAASRAKSEFLANMSHEIRTPMTAILGYADVLLSHLNNPDNVECVRRVKRNAHHLLEIINDILDLSKIEAGKLRVEPRPCSPQEVVADVLSLMEIRAREKDIALSAEFDGELPEAVETDPTRLRQILINLVGNAVKFTERGEVRLGVRYLPGPGRPRLEFAVTDTGVGMTPDQLSQLFRPFTQAHPAGRRFGGTGLGLTISQRLASMLGGTISARSEPGKGSTFTLVVDAGEVAGARLVRPAGARPRPEEPRPAPARLGGRVLVADDRRDIRYLAQYFLEEAGAEVTTAENGRAALDAVRRAAEAGRPFSAVVLDIQMPEMDGYEAARRLRAEGFAGAVIALTAAAMPGDREKCLRAGCDEYLCKPVERDRLVEAIARCTRTETAGDRVSGAARGRASVLIVEDNRDASGALAKLLTMQGYEVRTAADARSGIEAARQLRPDVVLMDIGLPDMSGLEAVRRIKSLPEADGVLCVALTGYSDEEARKQILAAGFDHLALKPIDFEALLRFLSARRERG
ncbi:MAG TPA: response regulator, partial [Gemmataceae bacterium]